MLSVMQFCQSLFLYFEVSPVEALIITGLTCLLLLETGVLLALILEEFEGGYNVR